MIPAARSRQHLTVSAVRRIGEGLRPPASAEGDRFKSRESFDRQQADAPWEHEPPVRSPGFSRSGGMGRAKARTTNGRFRDSAFQSLDCFESLGWLLERRGSLLAALLFMGLLFSATASPAQDVLPAFDAANRLYEQGKYPEAAEAYEKLMAASRRSDTLCFNLGNAWFKAGQTGRAIAAWRQAERLAPRDPNVLYNLNFARKKVSGADAPAAPLWQRALTGLTLNEWAVLAGLALWLWFALLAWLEFRPAARVSLRGYPATAGAVFLILAGCLGGAARLQLQQRSAVVIVPEAIARTGPLEEAKVLHHFRDGAELGVEDDKEVTVGDRRQVWLFARDAAGRAGWLKRDQVVLLTGASR